MHEERARLYASLHAHCALKPFAIEQHRRHETLFKANGRVFAFMNSPARPSVTVMAPRGERGELRRHPAVCRARWVGWLGWVTVSVTNDESLRLAAELIDRSYELATAPRRR
jgi:predicted DNA-binding protein (MmcQ/YjbR family)